MTTTNKPAPAKVEAAILTLLEQDLLGVATKHVLSGITDTYRWNADTNTFYDAPAMAAGATLGQVSGALKRLATDGMVESKNWSGKASWVRITEDMRVARAAGKAKRARQKEDADRAVKILAEHGIKAYASGSTLTIS